MSNEFVMVPREWVETTVAAGAGEVMVLSDIATLAECLSQEHQGEPVAHQVRDYLATAAARQNLELATDRDIYKAEVDRLLPEIDRLRAQLAERDALLREWLELHRRQQQPVTLHERTEAALSASAEPSAPVERGGLKECPKGYGHGGQWCGPSYNCWLDRRSDEEKARAALEQKS